MIALGEALQARGHTVSLFLDAGVVPPPSTLGLVRLDLGPADGGIAARLARGAGPIASVLAMTRRFGRLSGVLPEAFARAGVEAVICDQTEPASALAAMRLGLPHASLAAALPLNMDEALPPPYVAWSQTDTPARRWLNRGGRRVTRLMMAPLSRAIMARARSWGLPAVTDFETTFSPRLQLTQLVAELDRGRAAPPPGLVHVGPLRRAERNAFALPDDGRPLAFCTLGTLQGARAPLLARMGDAAAMAGCRPVLAHAGAFDAGHLAALPAGAVTAAFLPQRAVLERAAVALCHGGMNTVMDALAAGAPLVIVPLGYEQGAIGARVEAAGAGLMVKPRDVGTGLARAVRRVLDEPGFREAAMRLSDAARRAGGAPRAAVLVERALGCAAPQRVEPLAARSSR